MAIGKFPCKYCGPAIVGHKKGCPELGKEEMKVKKVTLEDLLRMTVISQDKDGKAIEVSPEFRVSVQSLKTAYNGVTGVHFLIHANGHNSDTLDFVVIGNDLNDLGNAGEVMRELSI